MVIDVTQYEVIPEYHDFCNESVDIKGATQKVVNIADLWKQWIAHTKDFVKHKWIYRYITDAQKSVLEKHYEILKDAKTNYSSYKRSFAYICKFMGLPTDTIILEDVKFQRDKKDKEQDIIAVRYSKGKIRVRIPDGVKLIHIHTSMDDTEINNLIPAFRSKTVGKYMYPSKRCFFTCVKAINTRKCGLEGQKTYKLTPKNHIKYAYIDPTYSDFSSNSVYVETEVPIPVEPYTM